MLATWYVAMRYLPTVDLWNNAIHAAVCSGQIRLQPGQWVRCGQQRPSRFVRWTGRSMQAVHPQGARGVSNERLKQAIACWPR